MRQRQQWISIVYLMVFLWPASAWALEVKHDDRSSFSGQIYAVQEDTYFRYISKKEIVYTISDEAIQRVIIKPDNSSSGIVIHPLKNEVLLYRNDILKKIYARVTLDEYLAYLNTYADARKLTEDDTFGFSAYFKTIRPGNPGDMQIKPGVSVYDNKPCDQLLIEQAGKEKKQQFSITYSNHLAIPKTWLAWTEFGIPEAVNGFPFKATLRIVDNNAQAPAPTSTVDRVTKFFGRVANKAERWVDELKEFTYEVTRVDRKPVSDLSFFQPAGFKRVNSIEELKSAFQSQPAADGGDK